MTAARPLRRLAALGSLVALALGGATAHALAPEPAPEGRCGDAFAGVTRRDRGLCQQFATAPRLPSTDPEAQAVLAVWSRVAEPVEALTERATGIVVLAGDARQPDGRPFAPAAWICSGTPPVIYVPHTLVDAVYAPGTGLGEDFLAFVLAHELGHRVNDFTVDGCPAAFGGDPSGKDAADPERRADFRGAFFAAVAGFDPRALARAGTVSRFLENEFRLRPSDLASRNVALNEALGWFDALEDLYQAGLALTLAGERGAASRFLARLDERLSKDGIPLPEVTLAYALALLSDAASAAPWLDALDRLPAPLEALTCRAVHPDHAAFADDSYEGRVRADPARREAARRAIERARRLIDRAGDLGAAPLTIASARACAALSAGDASLAVSLAEAAKKRATRAAPAVQQTLDANLALARFADFLASSPAPAPDPASDSAMGAWRQRLAAARPRLVANAALDRYVAHLLGQPSTPFPAGAPKCSLEAPPVAPLPPLGALATPAGACPSGWARFDDDPSRDTAVCRKDGRALVRVSLPPLADPPLPGIDATVVLFGAPPAPLRTFAAWTCGCDHLTARGVTDLGENAWLAACPRLGMPLGLVLADQRGRVRRVMLLP